MIRVTSSLKLLELGGHVIDAVLKGTERELVGRGQVIILDGERQVLFAGSDPRADGCAIPVVGPIRTL